MDQELKERIYKMTKKYAKKMIGSEDIEVRYSKRMRSFVGQCYHHERIVEYGEQFCEANASNDEALRWVVVHECAHLKYDDHSKKFVDLCAKYHVDAYDFADGTVMPAHYHEKFKATCPECGFSKKYFNDCRQRLKQASCPKCGNEDMSVKRIYRHKVPEVPVVHE